MWQDCLDCGLIFIEELMIPPEIAEQCKLIFEGASTHLHIKQKGDATLLPTPVIMTSNNLPWKWCGNEQTAMQARMFLMHCTEQPWLKNVHKPLHPGIWACEFQLYIDECRIVQNGGETIESLTEMEKKAREIQTDVVVISDEEDIDEELLQAVKEIEDALTKTQDDMFGTLQERFNLETDGGSQEQAMSQVVSNDN